MGVWAVPNTMRKAKKLARLFERPITGAMIDDGVLSGLVGDDGLSDIATENPRRDLRTEIAKTLFLWHDDYDRSPQNFRDTFERGVWDALRGIYERRFHGRFSHAAGACLLRKGWFTAPKRRRRPKKRVSARGRKRRHRR